MRIHGASKLLSLSLLVVLGPGRPADPRSALEAGAAAMGGLDLLRRLPAVRVVETGHEYLISTPTTPDGPRRMALQSFVELRSRSPDAIRWWQELRFPMRRDPLVRTVVATGSAGAMTLGGRTVPDSPSGWRAARAEAELAPERVLLTALGASRLETRPSTTVAGAPATVVRFPYREGSVDLALDDRSHLPVRVTRRYSLADDPFMAMIGDATLETTWSAWSVDSSGLWYPRQRTVTLNGEPYREYVVTDLTLVPSGPTDSLAIPDSVVARFHPDRPAAGVVRLAPRPVGPNVVLYLGGNQSFAVRQGDGVVVVEAPESADKSRAVLGDLRERWPGASIKAVVATSPMWMHLGGLREYVARGIPLYATAATATVVRRFIAGRHMFAPDSLAKAPRSLELRTVSAPLTLGRGEARLDLIPAFGPHGAAMLLTALPALHLLYASDILAPDVFEPVFKAAYRAELLRTVDRLGVSIDSVFGLHVAPMSVDAVRGGIPIGAASPPR